MIDLTHYAHNVLAVEHSNFFYIQVQRVTTLVQPRLDKNEAVHVVGIVIHWLLTLIDLNRFITE